MAVTLWRSKRAGKPRGPWLASWREGGRKISWNTHTEDHDQASKLADAEWGRRKVPTPTAVSSEEAPKPPVPPAAAEPSPAWAPPPSTTTNGARTSIAELLARATASAAPPPPISSSMSAPAGPSPGAEHVFTVFARAATFVTRVGLEKAVRLAGREPDEMEESEEKLINAGWKEIGAKWFGQTELGPYGKIFMGATVAGVGMYIAGTPIEKADEPKALPAAESTAPEGAGD